MASNRTVAVFGAYGHTGRFVVAELIERGWTPILCGRDLARLNTVEEANRELDRRPSSVDDPASLDRALVGAAAIINCAGPFAATSGPVIDAALRARVPYLDVAAEIEEVTATFDQYASRARDTGTVIMPAMAFYGGLGDLLATAALGDWPNADEISIAYGLSSWKPTLGTRATSAVSNQRRNGQRIVFSNGKMVHRTNAAPISEWIFPAPLGAQDVMGEFTMVDSVTIARHLKSPEIRSYMTLAAIKDLSDEDVSPPAAVDSSGRSSQTFLVEVVARLGNRERRANASGRDIYAITAPLVVEATQRLLSGFDGTAGVFSAGELFDAQDFLRALSLPGIFASTSSESRATKLGPTLLSEGESDAS